ncbi:hypothetical protein LCGC14_2582320 [marine sediment metagenome]|uniref:Uncharacterized protein n=1 Tax=marine sediment metagenome TaxID=412755 RepID=A0A0F9AEI1_9ZZZZ
MDARLMTKKEILALPLKERRKIMSEQADRILENQPNYPNETLGLGHTIFLLLKSLDACF